MEAKKESRQIRMGKPDMKENKFKKWFNIFLRTFFIGSSGDPCPYCETPTIESAYWVGGEKCPKCDWRSCKF